MLNADTDYEWVAVPADGNINGDVMPARDNEADGSWRVLDWEDYLFLLEAFYERANWDTAVSAHVSPGDRVLSGSRLAAVNVSATMAEGYMDKDYVAPSGLIPTTSAATIRQALGNPDVSLESVALGRPLFAEEVRKMFWNYAQLKRAVKTIQFSDVATAWIGQDVYTRSNGDTYSNTPYDCWGRLWNHGNASRVGSPFTALTISYKSTIATYPHATAAVLYVKVHSFSNAGGDWDDVLAMTCTVSQGGAVAVPSFAGIAGAVCAAHGLAGTTSPSYISSGGGNVSISSMMLAVDNDFPAEIDSLNWTWQPTPPTGSNS